MLCPNCGTDVGETLKACPKCSNANQNLRTPPQNSESIKTTDFTSRREGTGSKNALFNQTSSTWYSSGVGQSSTNDNQLFTISANNFHSLSLRVLALLFDCIIIFLLERVIAIALGQKDGIGSYKFASTVFSALVPNNTSSIFLIFQNSFAIFFTLFASGFLYFVVLEASSLQGTFGKRIFGLRVYSETGEKLSFLKAVVRHLCKNIWIFPLLFFALILSSLVITRLTPVIGTLGILLAVIILIAQVFLTLINKKSQAPHDFVSKSYVLVSEKTSFQSNILPIAVIVVWFVFINPFGFGNFHTASASVKRSKQFFNLQGNDLSKLAPNQQYIQGYSIEGASMSELKDSVVFYYPQERKMKIGVFSSFLLDTDKQKIKSNKDFNYQELAQESYIPSPAVLIAINFSDDSCTALKISEVSGKFLLPQTSGKTITDSLDAPTKDNFNCRLNFQNISDSSTNKLELTLENYKERSGSTHSFNIQLSSSIIVVNGKRVKASEKNLNKSPSSSEKSTKATGGEKRKFESIRSVVTNAIKKDLNFENKGVGMIRAGESTILLKTQISFYSEEGNSIVTGFYDEQLTTEEINSAKKNKSLAGLSNRQPIAVLIMTMLPDSEKRQIKSSRLQSSLVSSYDLTIYGKSEANFTLGPKLQNVSFERDSKLLEDPLVFEIEGNINSFKAKLLGIDKAKNGVRISWNLGLKS